MKFSVKVFLACFGILWATSTLWAAGPEVTVVLKPDALTPENKIPGLAVQLTVRATDGKAGSAFLSMPLVSSNVDTGASRIGDLQAEDADGKLLLKASDTALEAGAKRLWIPERDISGALTVHYHLPITNIAGTRGAAPPLELRTETGAFSAGGSIFLALPSEDAPHEFEIKWDLSALPEAAVALSSFGVGNVSGIDGLTPSQFANAYFMAGLAGDYQGAHGDKGFFGGWQGETPFDAAAFMAWGENLYAFYREFFDEKELKPFGVFFRSNDINPGGGMELHNSFIVTYEDSSQLIPLELTLAHEMLHSFVGSLDEPYGLQSSWFGEGLAVYYQRMLPFRAGKLSAQDFVDDINSTAARYYTNILNDTPNSEIPKRFWADTRVRVLPYDRGSMYFVVLDGMIRTATDGKKSLDDLVLAVLKPRKNGEAISKQAWEKLLEDTLGKQGLTHFHAMLDGALMVPKSGAFGPCFQRTSKMLRRYELGFEPKSLIETPRLIRGIVPGSAAAKAGLLNGDEILKPVPQDGIQGNQTGYLTLEIRRGDKDFSVQYLPRGEAVDTYQWEIKPGADPTRCAFDG